VTACASYDVAIIGAGPAGSTAAIMLARAGRSILLIEKQRFPRPKVCGGCLSGAAASRLRELLGDRTLPGVAGVQITFVLGGLRVDCHPQGTTWVASRAELDAHLAEAAAISGATVRFGEPARLERGDARWDVVVGGMRVRADTILLACGLPVPFPQLGIQRRRLGPAMIGQHWIQPTDSGLPAPGCVELHWLRGGYIGLASPNARHCMVALAIRAEEITGNSPLDDLRRLNSRAPAWDGLRPNATRQQRARCAAGFPWAPRRLGVDNVLLIGDAAGYAEPFTGEGIAQALRSADCAARAVLEGGDVLGTYSSLLGWHIVRLWRTRSLGMLLNLGYNSLPTGRVGEIAARLVSRAVESVHIGGVA
jgi:flavin-dependent dehydrogenase